MLYKVILISIITTTIFISISLSESSGHRSGCHRWHTCPSDTGSYTYVPKYENFEDDDEVQNMIDVQMVTIEIMKVYVKKNRQLQLQQTK